MIEKIWAEVKARHEAAEELKKDRAYQGDVRDPASETPADKRYWRKKNMGRKTK